MIAQPERVQRPGQIRHRLVAERAHHRLHHGSVDREVQFRQPGHRGESAVVLRAVAPERADVVERAGLEARHPVAGDEAARRHIGRARRDDHLIETRRQAVDDVHQLHEFLVLFGADLGGNEEREMPDLVGQAIHDRPVAGPDVVNIR